jgi:hypothetical protein
MVDLVAELLMASHRVIADLAEVRPGIAQGAQGERPGQPAAGATLPESLPERADVGRGVKLRLVAPLGTDIAGDLPGPGADGDGESEEPVAHRGGRRPRGEGW